MSTIIPNLVYRLPLWVIGVSLIVILVFCMELGARAGAAHARRRDAAQLGSGDIVLTGMLALLGLVLAFTYGFSVSRADQRKQAVIDEANAIGTAYLRADFAPEPARSELRDVLARYAESRLITRELVLDAQRIGERFALYDSLHAEMWRIVSEWAREGPADPLKATAVVAVNQVIDQHSVRLATSLDKLPGFVLGMLMMIATTCVAMTGYNASILGKMNRLRLGLLTLILAFVMTVIVDFDRPWDGLIRVSQGSLEHLVRSVESQGNSAAQEPR